jgi:hypothetical protein
VTIDPPTEFEQQLDSLHATLMAFEADVDADVSAAERLTNGIIADPTVAAFQMARAQVNVQKMLLVKLTQIEGRLRLLERQLLELRADIAASDRDDM